MTPGKYQLQGKIALLALIFVALSSPVVAKDFYRWKDANGITHYSEKPPKGTEAVKVRASNTKMPANGYTPQSTHQGEPAEEQETTKATPAVPTKDPQRCETAKNNAKTLQEKSRIRIKDEKGEYRYLDQEEIAEKLKTALQIIEEEC